MLLHDGVFLFLAALAAGALNSVAGGGGFIAFPALVMTGIPPINANATNTAALWPGTLASTGAYRDALVGSRKYIVPLIASGMVGGLLGAIILLKTPQRTFLHLVPWLLLSATALFAISSRLTRWLRQRRASGEGNRHVGIIGAALFQLFIALYIGFFGAGAGILMLAMFSLMGVESIHTMNGLKTLLASICNGMALIAFIVAKAIFWPQALLMVVGAAIGGYAGAYYAQKIAPQRVRLLVIFIGLGMAAYFFVRGG